jgi:hypothetical protein
VNTPQNETDGSKRWSVEEALAAHPDVRAFVGMLRVAQGGASMREIAYTVREGELGYISASTVWRYLTGKAVVRTWRICQLLIEAMSAASGSVVDLAEAQQLWDKAHAAGVQIRAQHRASDLKAQDPETFRRIAESGGRIAESKAKPVAGNVLAPLVIHDGQVVIADPAVLAGRSIEIHGGEVVLVGAALRLAGQIVVYGGKVILGKAVDALANDRPSLTS